MSNHHARFADLSCLKSNDPEKVKRCIFKAERGAIDASRARYQPESPYMTASADDYATTNPPRPLPPHILAMDSDQLKAELDKYAAHQARPQWSLQDQITAAIEAFAASAAGRKHDANLHPLAVASLRNGRTGLRSLATAIGNAIGHPLNRGTAIEILALNAIGTDHLDVALREAATATLHTRAATWAREIAAITRDTEVRDYRPTAIGTVDIGLSMPDAPSTSVFLALTPAMDAQEVRLFSTHGKLIISEQLFKMMSQIFCRTPSKPSPMPPNAPKSGTSPRF